jgi:hypothetical protein
MTSLRQLGVPNIEHVIADTSNGSLLHEKLTASLDGIEYRLTDEISARAPEFFSAVGELQNLSDSAADIVHSVCVGGFCFFGL